MASGIFLIFDDIAALLDDVAAASKIATRKTAGILGDDLAVNAEKATGFLNTRELPVLWTITKGSFINKCIIIPLALLLTAFFPAAITVILVIGGLYLAYEGAEKIFEFIFHRPKQGQAVIDPPGKSNSDAEKIKIKAAVTTDFILSVEIVILALGTVLDKSLTVQLLTVSFVALLATVGVYGLVALIVRMDDLGYKLIKNSNNQGFSLKFGQLLVKSLPITIKVLEVVGTIALLLVSGGIFVHNIDFLHHVFPQMPSVLSEFLIGFTVGIIVLIFVLLAKKVFSLMK